MPYHLISATDPSCWRACTIVTTPVPSRAQARSFTLTDTEAEAEVHSRRGEVLVVSTGGSPVNKEF